MIHPLTILSCDPHHLCQSVHRVVHVIGSRWTNNVRMHMQEPSVPEGFDELAHPRLIELHKVSKIELHKVSGLIELHKVSEPLEVQSECVHTTMRG
jgi:hypothetical protein